LHNFLAANDSEDLVFIGSYSKTNKSLGQRNPLLTKNVYSFWLEVQGKRRIVPFSVINRYPFLLKYQRN